MHSTLIPLVALLGTLLLLAHSWRARGPRFTAALGIGALAFGFVRPAAVRWITVDLAGATPPYEFPATSSAILGGAPLEAMGWLFAAALGVFLGARLAARTAKERHLPSEVAWASLVLGAVSYAVESAAAPAGLWSWNISASNRFFHDVPGVAVLDWLTVGPDLVLPLLLLAPGRPKGIGRARFLSLLVFPVHMAAHAGDALALPLAGVTPSRLWHAATLVACAAAPFVAPRLVRQEGGGAAPDRSLLPDLAALLLLGATSWVHAALVIDPNAALVTALPLAILATLARFSFPALVLAALGAATLFGGARFVPNAIPLVFAALARGSLRCGVVAIGAVALLVAAALAIAWLDARHRTAVDAIRRADATYAAGDHARALALLDDALAAEPRNAVALHKRGLVLFGQKRVSEARVAFEQAMAESPTDTNMLRSTAIFFKTVGDPERAKALNERAGRLRPLETSR